MLLVGRKELSGTCLRGSKVLATCDGVPPHVGAGTPTREERVTGEKVSQGLVCGNCAAGRARAVFPHQDSPGHCAQAATGLRPRTFRNSSSRPVSSRRKDQSGCGATQRRKDQAGCGRQRLAEGSAARNSVGCEGHCGGAAGERSADDCCE